MTQEAEGIRIVLSSVQLAAVLADDSISEDATWSNRLWGGLRLVGGVVELAGAGVLCLAPEPTMASKVGCVVFGVRGADTTAAGARQVLTGRDIQSLTHSGTAALAAALGADSTTANAIGMTVDIAVPISVAGWVGAVRVASIRAASAWSSLRRWRAAGWAGTRSSGLSASPRLSCAITKRPATAARSRAVPLRGIRAKEPRGPPTDSGGESRAVYDRWDSTGVVASGFFDAGGRGLDSHPAGRRGRRIVLQSNQWSALCV